MNPISIPLQTTILKSNEELPLTCSRAGTCCHGNLVRLNPWELAQLARASHMSVELFKKSFTNAAGTILRFDGKTNSFGKKACRLYKEGEGCSVHSARPLACRLFPIGRQIQNQQVQYIFQGTSFPCLKECPEVTDLPKMTVSDYLEGQQTGAFEEAQDGYLEIVQNLADIALSLLLDTGLAASGDKKTLASWRKLGNLDAIALSSKIDETWLVILLNPELNGSHQNASDFVKNHNQLIETKAQELLDGLTTFETVREAADLMMTMALFLAHAVGADALGFAEHWIAIAKENGAEC